MTVIDEHSDPRVDLGGANWLHHYNAKYLLCRRLRHAWDEGGFSHVRLAYGLTGEHWTCLRCGTTRLDVFDEITGERVESAKYDHPDDYKRPDDTDAPSAPEIRLALAAVRSADDFYGNQISEAFASVVAKYDDGTEQVTLTKRGQRKPRRKRT